VRIAIVGSRNYDDLEAVRYYVRGLELYDVVVSGHADGVDKAAEKAALDRGMTTDIYPVNWRPSGKFDRAAGMKRNALIVDNCDLVVAFWDGESRGTLDTINKAVKRGKTVIINPTEPGAIA
jgi:hypothetical protein